MIEPHAKRLIALVSPVAAELTALLSLFESKGWATIDCHSVRACLRSLHRHAPRVVVTRHRLGDGFSDDILAALGARKEAPAPRAIVLLDADSPTALEVRQLALGADCVLRYPVRSDVLVAYVTKYYSQSLTRPNPAVRSDTSEVTFCGAILAPLERTLQLSDERVSLTPREVTLIELLVQAPGSLVTYERLYSEVLERKFRGDTSNMRVLLGKLGNSCQALRIQLRRHVKVVPKAGYRYESSPTSPT